MGKNYTKYLLIALTLGFFSCNLSNNEKVLHQTLVPTDFSSHVLIEGQVNAVNTEVVLCPPSIEGTIVYIVEDGAKVQAGDTVCILENRELENRYDDIVAQLEQSEAQYEKVLADLEMSYALLMAQVESNKTQTSIANLDSVQLRYLSEQQRKIKELDLERAAIEKEKLQKQLHYLEIINQSKLRRQEISIEQNQKRVQEYKELLSQMVLTSPNSGIARRANVGRRRREMIKEGDEVWYGMSLVEIPDISQVNVFFTANETQFKRMKVGDAVEFTFDAMAGNKAWGKIQKKAAVGQSMDGNSGVKVFDITASVDSFITLPEVGISANCKVIFEEVKNSLVVPQVAVFQHDVLKVVFVKNKKGYERREVKIITESPGEVVIGSGLNPYEELALNHPPDEMITNTIFLPINETIDTK